MKIFCSSPQVRHPVFSFPAGSEGASRSSQSVGLDTGVNDEGMLLKKPSR